MYLRVGRLLLKIGWDECPSTRVEEALRRASRQYRQATEAIVDAGLKYGKPFAVVPCCVFADLFPARGGVRTHAELCAYLASKAGCDTGFLRFEGKNKVVYRKTGAPPRPELEIAQPCDPGHLPPGVRVDRVWHPEE